MFTLLSCFAAPSSNINQPTEQEWDDYFRERWNDEPEVYISDE